MPQLRQRLQTAHFVEEVVTPSAAGGEGEGEGEDVLPADLERLRVTDGPAQGTSFRSTHHAPQFVDSSTHRLPPAVLTAQSFLDAEKTEILHKVKNNKHKAEKKAAKQRASCLAEDMAGHMQQHGWAVVDHFIPLDAVRRLRIEFDLFREHFEKAEIWIGKRADVGAQLRVPSVRGDKVL